MRCFQDKEYPDNVFAVSDDAKPCYSHEFGKHVIEVAISSVSKSYTPYQDFADVRFLCEQCVELINEAS